MAYTGLRPADTQTISQGPADIRDELQGIVTGQIVNAGLLNGIAAGNAAGKIPISNGMVNTNLNADKVDGMDASAFAAASHTHNAATTANSGFMSTADRTKLDGIAAGAQVNPNTFSNVRVGSTTIQADSVADTLELVAGSNIALTPDATNDRVTIAVTGKVANAAIADTAAVCTGNSATASTLATARTIGINGDAIGISTSFNGGTNITIPLTLTNSGVNAGTYTSVTVDAKGRVVAGASPTTISASTTGNAATSSTCSGNSATATKLATARAIAGIDFDGSKNIAIPYSGLTGLPTIPSSTAFDGGHSFTENGYQKLSNGLILQWGYRTDSSMTITFPITFPNACLNVSLSTIHYTKVDWTPIISGWSITSFTLSAASYNFTWLAIGY